MVLLLNCRSPFLTYQDLESTFTTPHEENRKCPHVLLELKLLTVNFWVKDPQNITMYHLAHCLDLDLYAYDRSHFYRW